MGILHHPDIGVENIDGHGMQTHTLQNRRFSAGLPVCCPCAQCTASIRRNGQTYGKPTGRPNRMETIQMTKLTTNDGAIQADTGRPTPAGLRPIAQRAADEAKAFFARIAAQERAEAARTYYTLLTRDDRASPWQIAFGDYSRADVMSERADLLEHDHRRINTTVIRTAPDQASIDRVVACLNAGRRDGAKGYPAVPADFSVTERSNYMRGYRDGQKESATARKA